MRTLTDEEKIKVDNKSLFIEQKAKLLHIYKSYAEELAYAGNDYDKGFIIEKREKFCLVKDIHHLTIPSSIQLENIIKEQQFNQFKRIKPLAPNERD